MNVEHELRAQRSYSVPTLCSHSVLSRCTPSVPKVLSFYVSIQGSPSVLRGYNIVLILCSHGVLVVFSAMRTRASENQKR